MTIQEKIMTLFEEFKELSVSELVTKTNASKQMVHRVLNILTEKGMIQKLGRTPKTTYRFVEKGSFIHEIEIPSLSAKHSSLLNKHFLIVDELGNLLKGVQAFAVWCDQKKVPFEKTLGEFELSIKKIKPSYDKHGNINGTEKLLNTKGYDKIWIDNLFYLDYYAIERFGKTPLGTMLHYAKQGQSIYLMKIMIDEVKARIHKFIELQNADAICFVPPTIKRETQFMKFLQNNLNISLPMLEIKKMSGLIPIPQKSIPKIDERIRNAENTFAITDARKFKHVVLIDDAVGSGSTINQIAGKIKLKGVAAEVTGIAIVGSLKGFDVITDV